MKWILDNFWLKVLAFLMGLLVWVHVATEKTYNHPTLLPLTEVDLKDSLSLGMEPPDSILVTVAATGKKLIRQQWRKQGVRLNATQLGIGRHRTALTSSNLGLVDPQTSVTLVNIISPQQVYLQVDRETSRTVPVQANLSLEADDGFSIGRDIRVTPAEVTLTGPSLSLARVDYILTDSSRLSGLRNQVTVNLPLLPPSGYGYTIDPDSVAVTVPVFPVKTRVYPSLPIVVFNAPPGSSVFTEPESVQVEVTGLPEAIDSLSANALTVSADFRARSVGGAAPVKFDCPPGFQLKSVSSETVIIHEMIDADTGN